MSASHCGPLAENAMLGQYPRFDPSSSRGGCDRPFYMGKTRFFGRNVLKNEPIYAAMDFEKYKIARTTTAVATGAALVLGIALIVVVVKTHKK